MSHPVLLLAAPPARAVRLGRRAEHAALRPRPRADVDADVDALCARRPAWVVIGEGAPLVTDALDDVVRRLGEAGVRTRLVTDGRGLDAARLGPLAGAGLGALTGLLHAGDDDVHDALVDEPGAAARLRALLDVAAATPPLRVFVRAVITPTGAPTLPALVARCAAWGRAPLELADGAPLDVDPVVDAVWRAAADADVPLIPLGLGRPPRPGAPAAGPPLDVDANLVRLLEASVPWRAPRAGTRVGALPDRADAAARELGGLDRLGATLGAHGAAAVDLPPCLGGRGEVAGAHGPGCVACPAVGCGGLPASFSPDLLGVPEPWRAAPGPRVVVVHPFLTDKVLTLSTIPGLARSLRDAGADVTVISAWDDIAEGAIPATHDTVWRQRADAARGRSDAVLDAATLADADLVVVPSWPAAARLLPRLPEPARLVVADWHLLDGFDAFRAALGASAWPERVVVHACFRAFAVLFRRSGVPPRQVRWRPYPFDLRAFPPGPPPAASTYAFAGGNQRRDWPTLLAAGERLRGVRPVRLLTRDVPAGTVASAVVAEGVTPLADFYEVLARARYVVVPVVPHPDQGAGITLAAMAHAAGRPVIATASPGLSEHVRDGVDGLLVPARDPDALAAAMRRLDADDALLDRLADGARRAGEALSTDAWARELLHGGVVPV